MTDYSENGESPLSDSSQRGAELFNAVSQAIGDWVADESIAVEREGSDIVADEDELVENISVMITVAVDETAE